MPENSGERPGTREAIERMVRSSVEAGASPEWARRKAVEAAQRADRKASDTPPDPRKR